MLLSQKKGKNHLKFRGTSPVFIEMRDGTTTQESWVSIRLSRMQAEHLARELTAYIAKTNRSRRSGTRTVRVLSVVMPPSFPKKGKTDVSKVKAKRKPRSVDLNKYSF